MTRQDAQELVDRVVEAADQIDSEFELIFATEVGGRLFGLLKRSGWDDLAESVRAAFNRAANRFGGSIEIVEPYGATDLPN